MLDKEPEPTPVPTPAPMQAIGWKTSEFFLTCLGALIGLILCFHEKSNMNEFGVILISSTVGLYSVGRGLAKITIPTRS